MVCTTCANCGEVVDEVSEQGYCLGPGGCEEASTRFQDPDYDPEPIPAYKEAHKPTTINGRLWLPAAWSQDETCFLCGQLIQIKEGMVLQGSPKRRAQYVCFTCWDKLYYPEPVKVPGGGPRSRYGCNIEGLTEADLLGC